MGEKGDGAKVKQMREMREAKWKAAQEAAKNNPKPAPKIDDTEVGTLDNEPRVKDLSTKRARMAAKATSAKSGRSGAASAPSGSRSEQKSPGKVPSPKLDDKDGDEPEKTAGSADDTRSRREAALAALKPRELGDDEGRCTGCGKVRAVRNGKIVAHQKGLGTQCPGAKKAPA